MARRILAVALALAGCVADDGAGDGRGFVEVFSGGGWGGSMLTRVYADDRVLTETTPPGGGTPAQTLRAGPPGGYARAAAVVAARGSQVAAALPPDMQACPDYGTDAVRADPPLGGVSDVSAQCPDQGLARFMIAVQEAIAAR